MAVVTIIMSVAAYKECYIETIRTQKCAKNCLIKPESYIRGIFALYPPVIKEMHKLIYIYGKRIFVIAIGLVLYIIYMRFRGKWYFPRSQKEYDNIYVQKGEDYSQLKSEIDELNEQV